jgi:hypothetical protein
MDRTVSVPFTAAELSQLSQSLDACSRAHHGFDRFGRTHDDAFTLALLKVARAEIAIGARKGFDLHLPPWATQVILERLAPAPVVSAPPARAKRAASRRATRRKARAARPRLAPAPAAPAAPRGVDVDDVDDVALAREVSL